MSGPWMDLMLDWAHDAGATVCWGNRAVTSKGALTPCCWVNVQLPDRVVEHLGPTLDSASWACMAELEPDPLDQPEAA